MNNNYENLPAVLNANQLAAALGISRAGAYQLLNTGTFPTLRIGKRLLVPKDKLIDWIKQNTGGGNGNLKINDCPDSICCTRWGAAVRACTHKQYNRH